MAPNSLRWALAALVLVGNQLLAQSTDPAPSEAIPDPHVSLGNRPESDKPAAEAESSKLKYFDSAERIPNRYLVIYKSDAPSDQTSISLEKVVPGLSPKDRSSIETLSQALGKDAGVSVTGIFSVSIRGFSFTGSEEAAKRIAADPRVESVAADVLIHTDAIQSSGMIGKWFHENSRAPVVLDRLSQRSLPLNGEFNYNATGSGVTIWVLDTGVWTGHTEFGGRAVSPIVDCTVANCAGQVWGIDTGAHLPGEADCYGHGTMVASNAAGSTLGVAKGAIIRGVKVVAGCSNSGSAIAAVAGVDWANSHRGDTPGRDVINLSFNSTLYPPLNAAVQNAINNGVVVVTSGGPNTYSDSCQLSPASTPGAIAVGSATLWVSGAHYSPDWLFYPTDTHETNYGGGGACLAVFAISNWAVGAMPQDSPVHPYFGPTVHWCGDTSGNSLKCRVLGSPTSFAAALVSGIATVYLQANPNATPAQVRNAIISSATTGALELNPDWTPAGTPNRLAFSLIPNGSEAPGGAGGDPHLTEGINQILQRLLLLE